MKWTLHTIHLGNDEYTFNSPHPVHGDRVTANGYRLKKIVQSVSDVCGDLAKLRVVDLGCLEGMVAIEFGLHGAEVVGIEGRKSNIEKADYARERLKLGNVRFVLDDVRNLGS